METCSGGSVSISVRLKSSVFSVSVSVSAGIVVNVSASISVSVSAGSSVSDGGSAPAVNALYYFFVLPIYCCSCRYPADQVSITSIDERERPRRGSRAYAKRPCRAPYSGPVPRVFISTKAPSL